MKRLEAVACDAELQEKPLSDLRKLGEYIEDKCQELMSEMQSSQKENSESANTAPNEDSNLSGESARFWTDSSGELIHNFCMRKNNVSKMLNGKTDSNDLLF